MEGEVAAQAMITELVSRAEQQDRLKARLINVALRRARQLVGFRESPKNLLITVLAAMREQLSTIGEELARQGQIQTAEDIFFLDISEVRRGLAGEVLRDLVAERRQAYEIELRGVGTSLDCCCPTEPNLRPWRERHAGRTARCRAVQPLQAW